MTRSATLLSIALAVPLCVVEAAQADTQYAGTGLYKNTSPAIPSVALIRRDDGTVAARVNLSYSCKGYGDTSQVLRAGGRLQGASFRVTARKRIRGMGAIRVVLSGSVADASVSGAARVQISSCRRYRQPFVLRTESAPAGAPAVPAPGTIMQGMTGQSAAGFRMPVALRVAKNGRVYATWDAMLGCRRSRMAMLDITPSRRIRPDGTFGGSQTYTVRYRGFNERYRVTFRGQFLADGARGTLSATMRYQDGGDRYVPCRTGTQTWTARAN
jgi:hypothetical protein